MPTCVVVLITKDLWVIHPPELFKNPRVARAETGRWSVLLGHRRRAVDIETIPTMQSIGGGLVAHLHETEYLEPWPACPLWLGVEWSRSSRSKLRFELMAADEEEAMRWLASHLPRGAPVRSAIDAKHESLFTRRGVETYRAVHHTRWVSGF
jgi:hypothetical protein